MQMTHRFSLHSLYFVLFHVTDNRVFGVLEDRREVVETDCLEALGEEVVRGDLHLPAHDVPLA